MKNIIIIFLIFSSYNIFCQTYEIRTVNKSGGAIGVDIRISSGTPPTTGDFITDIKFGIKWLKSYNINLTGVSGSYNIAKSGGEDNTSNPTYEFQAFGATSTPYNLPTNLVLNSWVEIMSISNNLAGTGVGVFEICEVGFNSTTDPNIGIGTAATNAIDDYTPTIGGSASNVPLPVELLNFQAQPQGKTNFLDWQTANEKDNDGFSIERSAEGKVFQTIGFVKGHGTTQEKQSYTFTDDTPLSISYYRLKMIDFDGSFEYSKVVSVIAANKHQKLNIKAYPNPARHTIAIEPFDTFESMNIYNLQGVLLVRSNQTEINTSIISSGIYILEVKSKEGDMSRIKFVKE